MARPAALALEMVLNEESERQALEGELGALEAAWREAEEKSRTRFWTRCESPTGCDAD